MTKKEYLNSLTDALGGMTYSEVTDIKSDIEAHFESAILNGKTEEEIAEGLGDPKELAAEFLEGADVKTVLKKTKKEMIADKLCETTEKVNSGKYSEFNRENVSTGNVAHGRIFVVLFNLLVMIPVWFILLVAILGICFIWAALLAFTGIFAFVIPGAGIYMVSSIFLELTLLALLVAIFCLMFFAVKYFLIGTKNYIKWNNKLWTQGF